MSDNSMIDGVTSDYISIADRGLQFGDGLFETLRYEDGELEYWTQHITRLQSGADSLGIECPDEELWLDDIRRLVVDDSHAVKLMLTRGDGGRGYAVPPGLRPTRIVTVSSLAEHPAEYREHGISAMTCRHRLSSNPVLAGIKHLNRLDNVLARRELGDAHQEGIVCDQAGAPVEGIMSNLFAVSSDRLLTPAIDDCGIDGIIRNRVLELADRDGIDTAVGLTTSALDQCTELFFCNSLIGIWPVASLGTRSLQVGAMTRRIIELLEDDREQHARAI